MVHFAHNQDERVKALVERADGNAYFLEELVRAEAEGVIDKTPETVLAMVEARLLRLDPEARNLRHTRLLVPENPAHDWRVEQTLVDPDELNDWAAFFRIDPAASRNRREPALVLERLGPVLTSVTDAPPAP